ncbi:TetR/AcrR family transcriptional regulator [uncultured Brevundimonas sp.]|uniref:TetR/AcrR family transcriptional regulator n=1 Tax=uncultured Brevundimonas sp. TaxID=213418 RepID=UPI0026284A2F|nr:TetR/AcrR family transcriptional regulator [uncultured Brevundimonas sp.]
MHGPADLPHDISEAKRRLIVRRAREHFISEGYAATRMEPIAREAGVSTATLYILFSGKAALFSAVIDDAAEDFARRMDGVRAVEGDARATLTSFAEAYAGFMGEPFVRSVFRLVIAERPRMEAVALRFFDKGRTEFGGALIAALERLSGSGALKPLERPSWAAGQLMGMIEHPVFLVPLVTGEEVRARRSPAEVAGAAVETFLARYGA